MFVQPIDYFVTGWLLLALACALYIAFDQYRNNPEPVVMKWGFVLVTLYMGPLGLLLYVLADKEPRPGDVAAGFAPASSKAGNDANFVLYNQHTQEKGERN
jgi:manganese oxidase